MKFDITKLNLENLRKQREAISALISWGAIKLIETDLSEVVKLLTDIEEDVANQSIDDCIINSPEEFKNVFICDECQSDNVEYLIWYNPNKSNTIDIDALNAVNVHCNDCGGSGIVLIKTNVAAKVVGYQVVSNAKSEKTEMHPDMDNEFCLYNLTQARKMLSSGSQWQLLAIWSGEITGSIQMFEGSPRD